MNKGSVIREVCAEDHILWQLPHRSLPTQEANAVGTWRYIAAILATISLFAAWHFMIGPLNFGVLIVLAFFVLFFVVGLAESCAERRYLASGTSHSKVRLYDLKLEAWESTCIPSRAHRCDALDICRLRVEPLPIGPLDSEMYSACWLRLSQEAGLGTALMAEDVRGRPFAVIAVAYPQEVMLDLAKHIKHRIDALRLHLYRLAQTNSPNSLLRAPAPIPIVVGKRFREPTIKPPRPPDAVSTLLRAGRTIEIFVPRGEQLESVKLRACEEYLLIERQLLLGHINTRIEEGSLISLRVAEGSLSDAKLVVTFLDSDRNTRQMHLLEALSHHEICWIAAELRMAGPLVAEPPATQPRKSVRFSIAQLLLLTSLVAAVSAAFAISPQWGWLYALQSTAIILCLASFSGNRELGRFARRSWTKTEIIAASVILGFFWLMRLLFGAIAWFTP